MKLNVGLWLGPAIGLRMGGPRRLVLNSPKTELERAPGFAHGHWPDFNQPGYRLRVDRRYGARPGAADALYVRATEMLKGEVRDRSGKRIGAVQDLVVAMHGGRADYVVIAFDRPWSTRNKLVAMPMRAFRSEGGSLIYAATPEQLQVAPSFDRAHWPDIGEDERFRDEVDRYGRPWRAHETPAKPYTSRGTGR